MWTPIPIATRVPSASAVSRMRTRGVDRTSRMPLAREAGDEERDHLVSDELVDEPVPAVDHARRRPVEARDELRELLRREPLGETGRAADVGEEERELDLGAARMLLDRSEARAAQAPVQPRRPEADDPERDAARGFSGERQSLHRGPAGIFPNTARMYFSWPRSPFRTARQASSTCGSTSETCSWSCSTTGSVTAALWRSALGPRKRARTPEHAQRRPLSSSDAADDESRADGEPDGHGLVEDDRADEHGERGVRVRVHDRARRPEAAQAVVPADVAESVARTPR